jgi:SAM-dependent methyltransferase
MTSATEFPCDLCGEVDAIEVPHCREYTGGQPIHICRSCGFVHVKHRRSAREIADAWSNEIFGAGYTAAIPAVTARLVYVAETLNREVPLAGRRVCEIGAGEGHFLELLRRPEYGADVYGIEPSAANGRLLTQAGIEHFEGTIEEYADADGRFDVVAVLWTLENCQDLRAMLGGARRLLKADGRLIVATGSRLLVPFKKPLHTYLSRNAADTHSFRFSVATLGGALAVSGFETSYVNRYIDHDVLLTLGRPAAGTPDWSGDDPLAVYSFFERWHAETALHYPREGEASASS